MKKVMLSISLMLLTAASGFAQSSCKVLCTTPDIADGETIRLTTYAGGGRVLDSTVVKGGKFEFTIPATKELMENAVLITHQRGPREWASTRIVVEPDATLKATLSYVHRYNEVYGSPLNFINNVYNEKILEFSDKIIPLRDASNDESLSEAERKEKDKQAEAAYNDMVKYQQEFAYQNLDNILGVYLVSSYSAVFDKDFTAKCLAELPAKWNDYEGIVKLREAMAVEA